MANREAQILNTLKDKNIVKLIEYFKTKDNFYSVMEYCNGGNLETALETVGRFSEEESLSIMGQIVDAFIGLDNVQTPESRINLRTIMHRDLKPANVLFHDGKLKLGDFGFAKIVDSVVKDQKMKQTYLGTPLYCCPQIMENSAYSFKCDVWSAGCILYECLFGMVPFDGKNEVMIMESIQKGLVVPSEVKVSEETRDLLKKMLAVSEVGRLSWEKLKGHSALMKKK